SRPVASGRTFTTASRSFRSPRRPWARAARTSRRSRPLLWARLPAPAAPSASAPAPSSARPSFGNHPDTSRLLAPWYPARMTGLGGLNRSPEGVVIGLVQLQLPVVATKEELGRQAERIVALVGKAKRRMTSLDLVVFPEYALHGLSMDTNPEIM